jgi:hypothetical protein
MDDALRAFVRERAGRRCEYCRLHEDDYEYQRFHVEHIFPKQHDGTDDPNNLCFSCSLCNWNKGPNLAGLLGGKIVALFNPRKQNWDRHFRWDGTILVGKTRVGIVTVRLLKLNSGRRVMLRENLLFEGRFPPKG